MSESESVTPNAVGQAGQDGNDQRQAAKVERRQARFERIVTIYMAVVVLWSVVIGLLDSKTATLSDLAAQRAQALGVAAFGELARADGRVTQALDVYTAWWEAQQQSVQALGNANAVRLQGDETSAQALEAAASRWQSVQATLADLTPLLSDPYGGDYSRFFEEYHREAYTVAQRQQSALRESDAWGTKSGEYFAALTMLATVLFLMGVALTVKGRLLRFIFTVVSLLMTTISLGRVVRAYLEPVVVTPEAAMARFVDGLILSNVAYKAEGETAERLTAEALASFDAAIALDETYAEAYQWRGITRLETRLLDADPERNAAAAADMERAIELGSDNSVVYTNLGWAYVLAGDPARGAEALLAAIDLEPTECTARFNLGLALLAAGQSAESRAAYDEALACALEESPDEQDSLLTAAVLDAGDLATAAPGTPGAAETVGWLKETHASLLLLGRPEPDDVSARLVQMVFAGSLGADGGPIDVGATFTPGTPTVYALLTLDEMPAGVPWGVRWTRDGELYSTYLSEGWTGGPSGTTWVRLEGAPLAAGAYTAEVYVGGRLLATQGFEVQAGQVAAMSPYASGQFQLSLNVPSDWEVVEAPTPAGYLYVAPAADASRYVWYTTVPWSEGAGDNSAVLSALVSLWHAQHPDLQYGEAGEFYLGRLADAQYVPARYTGSGGESLQAMLVGMLDGTGDAHVLVLQAPEAEFDALYGSIFDPMLRSLSIQP